jgi:DNA modification methylase
MQHNEWTLRESDSLELMNKLAPDSVDGVITDPPYCSGGRTSAERLAPPTKKYLKSDKAASLGLGGCATWKGGRIAVRAKDILVISSLPLYSP